MGNNSRLVEMSCNDDLVPALSCTGRSSWKPAHRPDASSSLGHLGSTAAALYDMSLVERHGTTVTLQHLADVNIESAIFAGGLSASWSSELSCCNLARCFVPSHLSQGLFAGTAAICRCEVLNLPVPGVSKGLVAGTAAI